MVSLISQLAISGAPGASGVSGAFDTASPVLGVVMGDVPYDLLIVLLLLGASVLVVLWNRNLRRSLEGRNDELREQLAKRREMDESLVHRAAFENVIAHISRAFLIRPASDVELLFEESLRQVGRFMAVDRGYVLMVDADDETVTNTCEWCAPGVSEGIHLKQRLPIDAMPVLMEPAMRGEPVILGDVTAIPDDQPLLRSLVAEQRIQSLMVVPMVVQRGVIGFIGFDSVQRSRTWSDEDVRLLSVLAELFGGALQRRESDEAIRESQQRMQLILDASPFPLGLIRMADDKLLFANDRLLELFELHKDSYVGFAFSSLYLNEADRQRLLEQVNIWGRCDDFETRMKPTAGEAFWAMVSATTIEYDGDRCLIATINDVTESRKAAEQMRQAREEAEAASRSKSEFLSNMSHEIRTPMTSVLGFAELLLDANVTERDRLTYAGLVRRHGEHLLTIINDILDLSKIEAGKLDVERSRCDFVQLMLDIQAMMQPRAAEKKLKLQLRLDSPIPRYIHSDSVRLRQILLNLIGNAIKFTERGVVTVRLALTRSLGSDAPPHLRVAVTDTGIGITEPQLKRLFEPFSQADTSTSRRFGGTGLGLTISQRLAKMLGGQINVTSTMGEGSTFTLEIDPGDVSESPAIESLADMQQAPAGPAPAAQDVMLRGRVLLAEDGPDNQRLIMHLLRRAGLDAELASNGVEAVEKVRAAVEAGQPFDLVLMDIQMPEMDGLEATRTLRRDCYAGAIVALTAHALEEERERCLDAGCDAHLSKPIMRSTFYATLASYLDGTDSRATSQVR